MPDKVITDIVLTDIVIAAVVQDSRSLIQSSLKRSVYVRTGRCVRCDGAGASLQRAAPWQPAVADGEFLIQSTWMQSYYAKESRCDGGHLDGQSSLMADH